MTLLWRGLLGWLCIGCSFQLSLPPSEPAKRTIGAASKCGGVESNMRPLYPLADVVSVGAAVTWVVHANTADDIKETQRKIERYFGYGSIFLFGTSAVYGFYVLAECGSLRREVDARREPERREVPAPTRRGFPAAVFEFRFGMKPSEAARACTASSRDWVLAESVAICRADAAANGAREIQFEFQMGALNRITVLYGPSDRLSSDYYTLYRSLLERYGRPQVEPAPLSEPCRQSLAQCLEQGEKPAGALWHWPSGSIELTPVWRDERAVLELRHAQEEPLTQ